MRFFYKAKNDKSEVVTGTVKAPSEYEADKVLTAHNLVSLELIPEHKRQFRLPFGAKITTKDRSLFARQVATMISAGLPLAKAITVVMTQARTERIKSVYNSIFIDLQEGYNFSTALSKHPEMFDRVFVSVVKSGETTGKLEIVLTQLAHQLENDSNFINKIKGVMYYPAFIFTALIGVAIYMIVVIIPQLRSVFDQANVDLPIATRMLLAISDFFVNSWFIVLIVLIAVIVGLKTWFSTEGGAISKSMIETRIPLIKKLYEGIYVSRFGRVMEMLISSGVPLLDALKTSSSVMKNRLYEESILQIIGRVEKGVPLSAEILKNPLFPQIVGHMVAVGEETGQLDKVLGKVSEYYEEEVSERVNALSTLVEPVVLIIIGVAVAFLVFAILVPIFNLSRVQ